LSRLVVARRPFVSDAFLVGALKRIPLFLVSVLFFFGWVMQVFFIRNKYASFLIYFFIIKNFN
jgi:hypothetical protein